MGAPTTLSFQDGRVIDTETGLEVPTEPFISTRPIEWEPPHEFTSVLSALGMGVLGAVIFHSGAAAFFVGMAGFPLSALFSYWKFKRQAPTPKQLDFYSQDAEMRAAMLEVDELLPETPRISPEKVMVPRAIPAGIKPKQFNSAYILPSPDLDLFEKVWK